MQRMGRWRDAATPPRFRGLELVRCQGVADESQRERLCDLHIESHAQSMCVCGSRRIVCRCHDVSVSLVVSRVCVCVSLVACALYGLDCTVPVVL